MPGHGGVSRDFVRLRRSRRIIDWINRGAAPRGARYPKQKSVHCSWFAGIFFKLNASFNQRCSVASSISAALPSKTPQALRLAVTGSLPCQIPSMNATAKCVFSALDQDPEVSRARAFSGSPEPKEEPRRSSISLALLDSMRTEHCVNIYVLVSISSARILLGACRWHLCGGLQAGFRHAPLADPS